MLHQAPSASENTKPPPGGAPTRLDFLMEAVRHLHEGLPVPDRWILILALVDLIEGEYARRISARRAA